jgi:hypothetical protein
MLKIHINTYQYISIHTDTLIYTIPVYVESRGKQLPKLVDVGFG